MGIDNMVIYFIRKEVLKMQVQRFSGYSSQQYNAQFSGVTPRLLIGQGLETRLKFDQSTGRPVEPHEVESQRATLYYPGLGVQYVKLPARYVLPKGLEDMAEVELISPEACTVGRNIYVRAEGIELK